MTASRPSAADGFRPLRLQLLRRILHHASTQGRGRARSLNFDRQAAVTTLGSPRLVIAGASGDSGKTLVSLGLLLAASRTGLAVRAFKKGPDYIDAAWLAWASAHPAHNLDTYLMGFDRAAASFAHHAVPEGLNLIEGNRGIYDGVDALGTHSTAELAKALDAPVVLVLNASKVTRTAAAWVLGCQKLDPQVRIAGVVLNQVANRAPRAHNARSSRIRLRHSRGRSSAADRAAESPAAAAPRPDHARRAPASRRAQAGADRTRFHSRPGKDPRHRAGHAPTRGARPSGS